MKMKKIALSVMVLMLAACGGKSADDYVGTWQRDEHKWLQFIEIKKDNGNYTMTQKGSSDVQTQVLSEKDGELSLNIGMGDMPLKLSDDKKTLLVNLYAGGSNSFRKVEDESCKNLLNEYQSGLENMPRDIFSEDYKTASANLKSLQEKYRSQCDKK
ncbi:hypothetical protein HMPREF9098_0836 [Kingella denitrificans ATCC 33394]|uniref:Lipoprotein n=2 Tax=Kingella denitrificans TaxID=502 RepID=F0EYA2_9NEIS|nr:hypothetical protein HMPREF9098_0836 [Kingella denitrificans ATCC 33394]